eukprot:4191491-Pleurochrysis_carterae.AAC.1
MPDTRSCTARSDASITLTYARSVVLLLRRNRVTKSTVDAPAGGKWAIVHSPRLLTWSLKYISVSPSKYGPMSASSVASRSPPTYIGAPPFLASVRFVNGTRDGIARA